MANPSTKAGFKKRIKDQCEAAGTYRPEFDYTVDILADMLIDYGAALEEWKAAGGEYVMEYTNKAGATNAIRSPHYQVVEGLRQQIVLYCRELGITPAGLKKINEKKLGAEKKKSFLDGVIENFGA